MEIEQLRQELNHLLESIVERSDKLSGERKISPLEIDVVLSKVNKMQEKLVVLRYMLQTEEAVKQVKNNEKIEQDPLTQEITEEEVVKPTTVLKKPEQPSVVNQLEKKTTRKLADSFNLNDRYLYANELFNKDMNAFNGLITSIDNVSTLSEAQLLVAETKQVYNWDDENERVQEMVDLIERKFS
ncbi:MAG: hypothetical protein J5I47_09210 [Vicingus serpentipes]|nr:hypothetical protein [Vicingus serpentipes]